jgi:DNA polymerase III epsilon subunit-like protein
MVLTGTRFWVIDVEGNGAQPPEIVEIAMVEVSALSVTNNHRHWYVRPEKPISPHVTAIHGLTDADVAQSPSIDDISDSILPWIEDIPIIGHNVKTEVDILQRSLPDWTPTVAIDTIKLARALRPGLKSYALGKLGAELGLEKAAEERSGGLHHHALFDATLTAMIFVELLLGIPEAERSAVLLDADILNPKQGSLL